MVTVESSMSRRTKWEEAAPIHLFWGCTCIGLLLATAEPYALVEIPTVACEFCVQAIAIGPFECAVPSNRCASLVSFILAGMLAVPSVLQSVQWAYAYCRGSGDALKVNTIVQSSVLNDVSTESLSASTSDARSASVSSVETNLEVKPIQLVSVVVKTPEESPLLQTEVHEVFTVGARSAYTNVMHATAVKMLNAADGLISALEEEDHSTKYRKAKLNKLMDILTKLCEIQGESWLCTAVAVYGSSFLKKYQLYEALSADLETVRAKIKDKHLNYEAEKKLGFVNVSEAQFEFDFGSLFREASTTLRSFHAELFEVNTSCTAEKDPANVLGSLTRKLSIQRS